MGNSRKKDLLAFIVEGKCTQYTSAVSYTHLPDAGADGEKDRHPYDAPYAAEILRKYEAGCWMAAGNDQ